MIATERFEMVEITSLDMLRDWLVANHGRSESVWLIRYKENVPEKHVGRLAVLDELLCFGWVDGLARKLDQDRTMQLISPRRQQAWAQSYKDRVARLESEGRMAEPGRAAVMRGKASGLWDAYAGSDRVQVPPDLAALLARDPAADHYFAQSAPSYRRNVLRWISAAKRPETRERRLLEVLTRSTRSERVPQM